MSPGAVYDVAESVMRRIRSPLLVFMLSLNFMFLILIYFGVGDRRAKDHETMSMIVKQCVEQLRLHR